MTSTGDDRAPTDSVLAEIAAFVSRLDYPAVPESVHTLSRQLILDGIGVMFAGLHEPIAARLSTWASRQGSGQSSTAIRDGMTSSDAALVTGSLMHALDFDDMAFGGHGTSSVLPACLVLGESARLPERELLTAYAAGMEVFGKIAAFGEHVDLAGAGWHATTVHAILGSVAGAARAARLDADATAEAIAISCSSGAGLRSGLGTMVKPLHAGLAATSAVRAIELAEAGVTGSSDLLVGEGGYGQAYFGGGIDWRSLVASLGQPFRMEAQGPAIKAWPFCAGTQRSMATLLGILDIHELGPADVAAIEVHIDPRLLRLLSFDWPRDRYEAKFSLRFSLAAAAMGRALDPGVFDDGNFTDPEFEGWRDRITVVADRPGLKLASQVIVTTTSGVTFAAASGILRGAPLDRMSEAEVVAKFRRCVAGYVDDEVARRLEAAVLNLGTPDNDFWPSWHAALDSAAVRFDTAGAGAPR